MNLSKLESLLDIELVHNTETNREKILQYINNKELIELIRNIINQESEINKIAKQSYRHSNGFDKILLIDKRPHYALRLHIWNPINSRNGHIHNHEWDLTGKVLLGSYKWELYEFEDNTNKDGFYHYRCIYNDKYREHCMSNEKRVNLRKFFEINMAQNSFYNLKSSVCHKITMTKEFSATLMLHGSTINQDIIVISENKLTEDINKSYSYYSVEELKILLSDLVKSMENKYEN